MKFVQLFLLLLIARGSTANGMQQRNMQIPVTVTNQSAIIATILFDLVLEGQYRLAKRFTLLDPSATKNSSAADQFFVNDKSDVRIITQMGHFVLQLNDTQDTMVVRLFEPKAHTKVIQKYPLQNISIMSTATILIQPTGIPYLVIKT